MNLVSQNFCLEMKEHAKFVQCFSTFSNLLMLETWYGTIL